MVLKVDYRLGGLPCYRLLKEGDSLMQVPDEIRKSVVFLCFRDSGGIKLAGTGFLMVVGMKEINIVFGYLVTAKHVIVGIQRRSVDGEVLVRINMKTGPSQFVVTKNADWKFHPDDHGVDVAVVPLLLPQNEVDSLPIPVEMIVSEQTIKANSIGIGDEVFLTGLFVNHYGRDRNLPIVRTGNIALMPEEPIQTQELGPIGAYLVEARSIGGLSGSPVFVYLGGMRNLQGSTVLNAGGPRFYLLGLMHGHWDVAVPGHDELHADALKNEAVNMGIAIVVPASKILETINQEVFLKTRERTIAEQQRATLPKADSAATGLSKSEFEDTLKKVSRRIIPSEPETSSPETSG